MSILDIALDAADELSLARPNNLVGVTDNNTAQKLYRHLVKTVKALGLRYDWQVLRREQTFTTTAAAVQTDAIPADFQRFVKDTIFNRTKTWRVAGPLQPDEWQAHQATLVTRVGDAFCIRGSQFLMAPTPAAGEIIAYEYITKYIGTNGDADTQRLTFTADNDVPYMDAELVTLGIVWRYRKAESLDYSEEFNEYERRFADLIKMDGGKRRIDMSETVSARVPVPPIVPDTLLGLSDGT